MHIAFLNPQGNFDPADSHLTEHPDFGGQLVYVKEVALAMAGLGHRVDILTRRIRDPEWPEFSGDADFYPESPENPRILRLPCGGDAFLPKEELWPHLESWVDGILAAYGSALPDVTTAHYADGGYAGALIATRAGLPFTFTGHSLGAQKMDKLGIDPAKAAEIEARFHFSKRIAAERLSMTRASRIVVSTDQERREQYAHPLYLGAIDADHEDRFQVIPPGVNERIFTIEPQPHDASLHRRLEHALGKAAEDPFVVVSSRLDEKKNILGVVRAFAASAPLRQRARLALFLRGITDPAKEIGRLREGEQAVLAPILDTIDKAGLGARVSYVDVRSQADLAAAYRFFAARKSVFALPSLYEPFGLAPIEAAACGLACVATAHGGPSEIFADGSGLLVDPGDEESIARGLIGGLDRFETLSRAGRERVRARYTWTRTAEAYLELLKTVLREGPVPREPLPALDASGLIARHLAGHEPVEATDHERAGSPLRGQGQP